MKDTIRPALVAETSAVNALIDRAILNEGYDTSLVTRIGRVTHIHPPLVEAGQVLLNVKSDGELTAVIAFRPLGPVGLIILHGLYVEPSLQRRGIGKSLMEAAKSHCREALSGCSMIIYANPTTAGFYARIGAIPIGVAPFVTAPHISLPIFAYPLNAV